MRLLLKPLSLGYSVMAAEPTEQGRDCDYKSAGVVKGFNSLPLLTDIFHAEDGSLWKR